MIKSLVPLAITSAGFFCVVVLFNNCSGHQSSSLPSNDPDSCGKYNNSTCSSNEPYLNPPSNNVRSTISDDSTKTQLQINGNCFLGPTPPKEHKIEFWIYNNKDSQKTDITDKVTPKCEQGRYFAILELPKTIDSGSYGLKGNLYFNGSTSPTSSTDRTFCYGTGCN